jgi:hypothetical protein
MRTEHSFTAPGADPIRLRRELLRQQRTTWFAWVCRLHELNSRMPTPESAAVLAIAQRRWNQARQALQRADGEMASADYETTTPR